MNNKITRLFIIIVLMMVFPISVFAANHYILQGGTGNGTTWSNALDDLPDTLIRGDTYYIADGTYGEHTFNDAESGTTYISIKKATAGDHGTDTGWQSTYGDGQAIFKGLINFTNGYYIWEGITGSGGNYGSYGFKIVPLSCPSASQLLGVPGIGYSSNQVKNVRVSHTAMIQCGEGDGTYNQVGVYSLAKDAAYASSDITISNNYLSNASSNMLIRQARNWTIADNYFDGNWSSSDNHGQQISPATSSNIFLYNNVFKNSSTFIIGAHNEGGGNSNWQVFNNIAIGGTLSAGFAMGESGESNGLVSSQFHNNTFVGVDFGGRGAVFVGTLTNVATQKSYAYNNLFYRCINPRMDNVDKTAGAIVHNNNAYLACTGIFNSSDESASVIDNINPFVNVASENFRLAAGVSPNHKGINLSQYFTTDKDGKPRGNSLWSIGAYRAAGPAPPENISITINQ
ncbi:MAG: hypothetical protein ACYDGO_13200 [Smithellaceae bacterium]